MYLSSGLGSSDQYITHIPDSRFKTILKKLISSYEKNRQEITTVAEVLHQIKICLDLYKL